MFAHWLMTFALVVAVAEGICRLILGRSLRALVGELWAPEPRVRDLSELEQLRALVRSRRDELANAREKADLAEDAGALTGDLVEIEARYAEALRHLEQAQQRRESTTTRESDPAND